MNHVVKLPLFAKREGMIAGRENLPRSSCPYEVGDLRLHLWMEGWDEANGYNIPDKDLVKELLHDHGCKHVALRNIFNHPDATDDIKRLAQMGMNNELPPKPAPWFPDLIESPDNVRPV